MLGFEGVLGDWLDRITDDRGGLLIDLDRLELPWGSSHLRTSGRIRIENLGSLRSPKFSRKASRGSAPRRKAPYDSSDRAKRGRKNHG